MPYYKNPAEMFRKRIEAYKKKADYKYAQYKKSEKNSEEAKNHYAEAQKFYRMVEDNKKNLKDSIGKTWVQLKNDAKSR